MKIIGIGTDIVEVQRISKILQGGNERFLRRILHDNEYERFLKINEVLRAHWIAKRFATKEACSKALGTGIGKHAQLTEIETRHDDLGKPHLVLHGTTQQTADRLGVIDMSLSLADERMHAVAFIVLTGE
uniref:Holo-[acyl-carrier-protein] synthase n=1 Tax=uncultured Thiotrichaceae bacterium TaxID=298394 RepID=A0A6S6SGZ7_9GAMM|nr:MAG: Holo-[acyl-carrier protein] synthase (EC [uncultured Thiotrichaceae bacterium]